MTIGEGKVVQLKVEPDISDAHVMNGLREAIAFSKENKCKSIFILLVPEENENRVSQCFVRTYTRGHIGEAVTLLEVMCNVVSTFQNYVLSILNGKH